MAKLGAVAQVQGSSAPPVGSPELPEFDALYEAQVGFVWRNARRLGVAEAALDDVVQDVFLVAHRKLGELTRPEAVRAWMFGILIRVVRDYRRTRRRRDPQVRSQLPVVDPDQVVDARSVHDSVEHTDAVRMLYVMLGELDDAKREVFVLAELEEMTEKEISEALGDNPNTVHSRLRAARRDFDRAVHRYRKRVERRLP